MATSKEQPCLTECGLRILLPLPLSGSQNIGRKPVNQYEQMTGPDGGEGVLPRSRGYKGVVTPLNTAGSDRTLGEFMYSKISPRQKDGNHDNEKNPLRGVLWVWMHVLCGLVFASKYLSAKKQPKKRGKSDSS